MTERAVIDSFYTYNTNRYGRPWVCRVEPGGYYNFDTQVGDYTNEHGKEGDLVVYRPVSGQIYGYGQKDYRDGCETVKALAVWTGERFADCDRAGFFVAPHRRNENEKVPEEEQFDPVGNDPVKKAVNRIRLSDEAEPLFHFPVKAKLFSHQIKGANMALMTFGFRAGRRAFQTRSPGYGILWEMGCGKSLAAIAITGAMYQMNAVKKVLVVAPSTVCTVWQHELQEYADFAYSCMVVSGTLTQRIQKLDAFIASKEEGLKIAVINYEAIWRAGITERLISYDADLVIADESQRIKTHDTKQAKTMHQLGTGARYKLALSGTPIQSNALDLFSQYRFLNPAVFGDNFYAFKHRYAVMGGYKDKQVIGYRLLDEMIRKEYSIAYRVTKKEVLDLPEQFFMTRYVSFEGRARNLYNSLVEQSLIEFSQQEKVTANNVLTKLTKLWQLTGGFLKMDKTGEIIPVYDGKMKALEDIVEDYVIHAGKKLVIFCRFLAEIEAAAHMLKNKKLNYSCIHGGVKQEERGEQVASFQNDPENKVFLAQIDTAGLGITLTAADTCVYYSLTYNYASYSQSLARIHRIGQRNTCTYIHLIAEDTIDEEILLALQKKEDLSKTVVDDWKKYFKKRPEPGRKDATICYRT